MVQSKHLIWCKTPNIEFWNWCARGTDSMKTVLDLDNTAARDYFLKPNSYCSIDLPEYFSFSQVLDDADKMLSNSSLSQLCISNPKKRPCDVDHVNYELFNNKKNKYQWRRLEIIHPVLYVVLVNTITNTSNWELIRKRFNEFAANKRIICCSIPLADNRLRITTLNWWSAFEQRSIACGLDYAYMGVADVENCYPSIYTHSIAWAIHSEPYAKQHRKDPILGNDIDKSIRNMHYGQTNGIPQGSVLMDFIAEMVLGYADVLLTQKLNESKIEDYRILRYRDDYRIFAKELSTVEEIIKCITIVLTSLNLNLNSSKTRISNNIVVDSIKEDKLYRIAHPLDEKGNEQKRLLSIYQMSINFPNSGSIKKELTNLRNDTFLKFTKRPNSYEQLIGIIVEIMRTNPTVYPICVGMLSDLFVFLKPNTVTKYISRIISRFDKEPFSEYLEIWLQRTSILDDRTRAYDCLLCQKIYQPVNIWNSTWMQNPIDESSIVDESIITDLPARIAKNEVDKFNEYDN